MTIRTVTPKDKSEAIDVLRLVLQTFIIPSTTPKMAADIRSHVAHLASHNGVLDIDAELYTSEVTGETKVVLIFKPTVAVILPTSGATH